MFLQIDLLNLQSQLLFGYIEASETCCILTITILINKKKFMGLISLNR